MATDNLSLPLDVFGISNFKKSYKGAMGLIDAAFGKVLVGSKTYDPASLADGVGATTTITIGGVALGDFVTAVSFDKDLQGISLTAYVSATDTVSVRFQNESGGTLDLASGTLRVRVRAH